MMTSLLSSSRRDHASHRDTQPSGSGRPSQVFASCAFISSMIVLFLFTGPMIPLSSRAVDIMPISGTPAPPASSALATPPLSFMQDRLELKQPIHPTLRQAEPSSLDADDTDEPAGPTLSRRSSRSNKPSKAWPRYRERTALRSSPSPAALEHDRGPCRDKSVIGDDGERLSDSDCQRDYDVLIDPPMFSPPDKRTQQGWVVLVVGVITIVTASLMM
ncbi:hypothetical protein POJ06DRAFT_115137 [Lipomyces tetrasporus]|uniref:Uncharacterized protein n=1 Tax=Lipomyces tetrasporus TaxID=54092 RepID=A0AAD7VRX6_9ASCO|nr:uncharacterized protein POJ06DRAFT_115137 [Lipomyces tetrasporus]KAJ8099698.1 hypothetical protein POJ06DRAFT_115137 [Lipomyces tetrasporus]